MRTIWQSLVWKEWHEHKWKLAALSGVSCGLTAIALLALLREDFDTLDGFIPALAMGMIPLTLFIGMGEAAGENAGRTAPFLQSLPAPLWKSAVWKLVFGAITCLMPMLLAILLVSVWYFFADLLGKHPQTVLGAEVHIFRNLGIEHPLWMWIVTALVLAGPLSVSLFIWTVALGVNRKSEVAAGGVALLGIVGWWVAVFTLARLTEDWLGLNLFAEGLLENVILPASSGGLSLLFTEGAPAVSSLVGIVAVALATHLLLALWYVLRFGRTTGVAVFSPQPTTRQPAKLEWLGLPRRSPLTAIVWKQFRESGPIALAGLAAILFFVALNVLADPELYTTDDYGFPMLRLIAGLTMNIGFLIVLIVGIGVFDRDLSPKLHTFWRSRPINPDLWFWTKYLSGLVVLAGALLIPIAFCSFTPWWWDLYSFWPKYSEDVVMAGCVFLSVYALSAATICLVRVTIYAAILSMGVLAAGASLFWIFLDPNDTQWTVTDWMRSITVLTLTTAVLATLLGWWAVRRDIGWKKPN